MLDLETIRRIALARHLYELGKSSLRTSNDLHLFAAVNLLQDAVEAFLIVVGEYVKAGIDQNTKFDKYFTQIDSKITPKELPFKLKLIRLNRVRVDSKHYGIQPARDESERIAVAVKEFFDEVATSVLGVNFSTVSAIDLLEDGDVKEVLLEAKTALETKNLRDCVISCRKVLFLEVESNYDIAKFKDGEPKGILGGFSDAPYYSRNPKYIAERVANPFDYIVLDHSKVSQELLQKGVDTTEFWNIWRLTPQIYRLPDKTWIWKEDFSVLDEKSLEDKAEYVFNATVDFAIALHGDRRKNKSGEPILNFVCEA